MRISIEWFLLDNYAMNRLGLYLWSVFSGRSCSRRRGMLLSFLGAAYDLIALSCWRPLLSLPGRIGCLLLLSLLVKGRGSYLKSLLALFCAYSLLGGALLLLTLALGEKVISGGVIVGTLPLRIGLYGLLLGIGLLRGLRSLHRSRYIAGQLIPLKVLYAGKQYELTAFVDTGNLLTERVSGLPVVLLKGVPIKEGLPFWVEGWGVIRLQRVFLLAGKNKIPLEAYGGTAPMALKDCSALLPGCLLTAQEGIENVQADTGSSFQALLEAVRKKAGALLVHTLRRKSARAPAAGGGEPVHPSVSLFGEGQGQADRAQPEAGGVHSKEV